MIRAAAAGAVDFARADPRDGRWWLRLELVLDALADDALAKVYTLNLDRAVALLARPGLTPESYDRLHDDAEAWSAKLKRAYLPWVDLDPAAGREDAIRDLEAQWVAIWGDPADPAVAARIEATSQYLRRNDRSRRP